MSFQCPIPWQVFIARVDTASELIKPVSLLFSPKRITSLDQQLYCTWLGNQYNRPTENFAMCLGHDKNTDWIEIGRPGVSRRDRLEQIAIHFRNSAFNYSLEPKEVWIPAELSSIKATKTAADGNVGAKYWELLKETNSHVHKVMAWSHIWYLRQLAANKDPIQIAGEVCQWPMTPFKTVGEMISAL
jgi:hypothetical protein